MSMPVCVCVCVCVCDCVCVVCLSASISPELHAQSFPDFLCMLPMAVARPSGIRVKVCYLRLPFV